MHGLDRLALHPQGFGDFQVDASGLVLHAFFVEEVRQLHFVLEVLGVEIHDLAELLQGPLHEAFLLERFGHMQVRGHGVPHHARLAVEIRQPLHEVHVVGGGANGLL